MADRGDRSAYVRKIGSMLIKYSNPTDLIEFINNCYKDQFQYKDRISDQIKSWLGISSSCKSTTINLDNH